jgi:hypothetical protein
LICITACPNVSTDFSLHEEHQAWPASAAEYRGNRCEMPPNEDLEICVMDYDGIVQALRYPCHKIATEWIDASNKERVDIQPTHWRRWAGTV